MKSNRKKPQPEKAAADEPTLLGLEQLPPAAQLAGGSALVAVVGIAVMMWAGGNGQSPLTSAASDGGNQDAKVIIVDAEEVPGMLTRLPADMKFKNDNVLSLLKVPESQKAYIKAELDKGRMRVGSISVWDSVAEDGDEIRLSAAGIDQIVSIRHAPRTFMVPHFPGGTIRISGTRDGGEGITLGVKTMLGPVHLPRLAVGEVMEIPVQ